MSQATEGQAVEKFMHLLDSGELVIFSRSDAERLQYVATFTKQDVDDLKTMIVRKRGMDFVVSLWGPIKSLLWAAGALGMGALAIKGKIAWPDFWGLFK